MIIFHDMHKEFSILATILMLIFFIACSDKSKESTRQEKDELESFYAQFSNLVLENPINTKKFIIASQNQIHDSTAYYNLTTYLAKCYYYENQIDSAIYLSKKTIQFCSNPQNENKKEVSELLATAYNDIGVYFQTISNRDSAISYLEKSAATILSLENQEKRIDIYINLADNYREKSNLPYSAYYYRKAMALADTLELHEKYNPPINTGLAHIYTELKNFDLAESYFLKVESVIDSLPPNELFYFSNTRGNYYYQKKSYEQALKWFYKTYYIANQYNNEHLKNIAQINLGEVFLLLQQNDSAKKYLTKARESLKNGAQSPDYKFYLDGLFASLYLQNDEIGRAEQLLSLPYNTTQISAAYIYLHQKRLEDLYVLKNNFKKAYYYNKKNQEYDDSVRQITIQSSIEELNFRYSQDTALLKRDIQIKKHKNQAQRMNNVLLTTILIFSVLSLLVVLYLFYRYRKNRQRMSEQLATVANLRLKNVQNRMSPHFVFNALNSMMPNLREYEHLQKPINNLVVALRNNLICSNKISISIEDEIANVKSYINLLDSLHYALPTINWKIDETVNKVAQIPFMIIQIPIENAIKYAFVEVADTNFIEISIEKQDQNYLIAIQDNGVGFKNNNHRFDTAKGTGSGLNILYETFQIINQKNKEKVTMKITSAELVGTTVSFVIPLNYKFEV